MREIYHLNVSGEEVEGEVMSCQSSFSRWINNGAYDS